MNTKRSFLKLAVATLLAGSGRLSIFASLGLALVLADTAIAQQKKPPAVALNGKRLSNPRVRADGVGVEMRLWNMRRT